MLSLYRIAAAASQRCDSAVLEEHIFYEWESCTSDIDKVLAYKDAYRQTKLWGPMQLSKEDTAKKYCFNQISPIPFNQKEIYIAPVKLDLQEYDILNERGISLIS